MGRPPAYSAETKARVVMEVLAGRLTVLQAARDCSVSQTAIGNWKRQFMEAGQAGLTSEPSAPAGTDGLSVLQAENEALKSALTEALVLARVWRMSKTARS